MKLVCPACGAACAAEAWLNDGNARQALMILLLLPGGTSRQSLSYMALFRPRVGKNIQWAKVLRLAADLKTLIELPHVEWDRAAETRKNADERFGHVDESRAASGLKRVTQKEMREIRKGKKE